MNANYPGYRRQRRSGEAGIQFSSWDGPAVSSIASGREGFTIHVIPQFRHERGIAKSSGFSIASASGLKSVVSHRDSPSSRELVLILTFADLHEGQ
jgi:hypothetical protein